MHCPRRMNLRWISPCPPCCGPARPQAPDEPDRGHSRLSHGTYRNTVMLRSFHDPYSQIASFLSELRHTTVNRLLIFSRCFGQPARHSDNAQNGCLVSAAEKKRQAESRPIKLEIIHIVNGSPPLKRRASPRCCKYASLNMNCGQDGWVYRNSIGPKLLRRWPLGSHTCSCCHTESSPCPFYMVAHSRQRIWTC